MVTAVRPTSVQPTTVATHRATARSASADRTLRTLLAAGRKPDTHDPAVVKQVASQFLSELFFAPLLAEAREFPLGRDLATGGRTEAIFGEQLDQRVADSIAAANPGLVQQMVRQFEQQAQRTGAAS